MCEDYKSSPGIRKTNQGHSGEEYSEKKNGANQMFAGSAELCHSDKHQVGGFEGM